jgi:hypothetical protein
MNARGLVTNAVCMMKVDSYVVFDMGKRAVRGLSVCLPRAGDDPEGIRQAEPDNGRGPNRRALER